MVGKNREDARENSLIVKIMLEPQYHTFIASRLGYGVLFEMKLGRNRRTVETDMAPDGVCNVIGPQFQPVRCPGYGAAAKRIGIALEISFETRLSEGRLDVRSAAQMKSGQSFIRGRPASVDMALVATEASIWRKGGASWRDPALGL